MQRDLPRDTVTAEHGRDGHGRCRSRIHHGAGRRRDDGAPDPVADQPDAGTRRAIEATTRRRPRHHRAQGAQQGARSPIHVGRSVLRGHPPSPRRPAGHRPEGHAALSRVEVRPAQSRHRRGGRDRVHRAHRGGRRHDLAGARRVAATRARRAAIQRRARARQHLPLRSARRDSRSAGIDACAADARHARARVSGQAGRRGGWGRRGPTRPPKRARQRLRPPRRRAGAPVQSEPGRHQRRADQLPEGGRAARGRLRHQPGRCPDAARSGKRVSARQLAALGNGRHEGVAGAGAEGADRARTARLGRRGASGDPSRSRRRRNSGGRSAVGDGQHTGRARASPRRS